MKLDRAEDIQYDFNMTRHWKDRVQWELAGMTDEKGIDPSFESDGWIRPVTVDLVGDRLVWRLFGQEDNPLAWAGEVTPGPRMLEDFVRLNEAEPEAIRDYARKWGVLELCEHGLPSYHNRLPYGPAHVGHCSPLCDDKNQTWEPVGYWRRYACQARGMLNIAAAIHQLEQPTPEDWDMAMEWSNNKRESFSPTVEAGKVLLSVLVDRWLVLGSVRFLVAWRDDGPQVKLRTFGLFGALAVQIMQVVYRTDGFAICTACCNPFSPSRKPRVDQRHYCKSCHEKGAPLRDAKRAQRQRKGESNGTAR